MNCIDYIKRGPMGIKDFSKVFVPTKEVKNLDGFKGETFAIDALLMIFQYSLGASKVGLLTNEAGEPTLVYNGILSFICNLKKMGILQIWVFDSVSANKYKGKATKERADRKDKAKSALELLYENETKEEEKIDQLEKVNFKLGKNVIKNIKMILDKLRVRWIECGPDIEAEQMCAAMTRTGIADHVYTRDTDAIVFGAKSVIRSKTGDKKKIYLVYELKDILEKNNITRQQLAECAVSLGCDFVEKVARVGPASVINKVKSKSIAFTAEQSEIIDLFCSDVAVPEIHKAAEKDTEGLIKWFVENMQFKRDRVVNMINSAF